MTTTSVNSKRTANSTNRAANQRGKNETERQNVRKVAGAEGKQSEKREAATARGSEGASGKPLTKKALAQPKRTHSKDATKKNTGREAYGFAGAATNVAVAPQMNLLMGGPALSVDAIANNDTVKSLGNFLTSAADSLNSYIGMNGDGTNRNTDSNQYLVDDETSSQHSGQTSYNYFGNSDDVDVKVEKHRQMLLAERNRSEREKSEKLERFSKLLNAGATDDFEKSFNSEFGIDRIRELVKNKGVLSHRDFNMLSNAAELLDGLKTNARLEFAGGILSSKQNGLMALAKQAALVKDEKIEIDGA